MKKIDWVRKLTSRKLWVALAAFISSLIIAFGGGSAMDCAKAIGARVAYPSKSLEKLKGLLKVRKKIPLLFSCSGICFYELNITYLETFSGFRIPKT